MKLSRIRFLICISFVLSFASIGHSHNGPDPIMRWRFDKPSVVYEKETATAKARLGPDGKIIGKSRFLTDKDGGALFLGGNQSGVIIQEDIAKRKQPLPTDAITISAWLSVDKPLPWGGIVGAFQDNGSEEFGWVLGYNNETFTWGLAGQNGNAGMTYLSGKTKYVLGKIYHVVATYDGKTMRLFVNGRLDAESSDQSGPIDYPEHAPFTIGAYHDANEFFGHRGRIREVAVFSLAAKPKWAAHEFSHHATIAAAPAQPVYEPLAFTIAPYLQYGTQTSMTVMWKTNRPATTVVHYGETAECEMKSQRAEPTQGHELSLKGLKPETQYFYRVESALSKPGSSVVSDVFTFQTAVSEPTPFAFAVISDTQGNPEVSGKLANFAWEQRPNFLMHPGDLVETGPNDSHWTDHFFASMHPLIRHVPFYPVLGNHEQNARNYFDYVSLPDPEYFYTFKFGNSQFFMIDSNRNVDKNSEQYRWLDDQLANSDATWKFVCHHHPPFSSDENDYGNLWKTNQSTRGDLRIRTLVPLYEKHNIDFVWNGHIHSYERTWPVRDGKAVDANGPIYMITGGGGGRLETAGPVRPFFQNTVRRGHHYSMVRINGRTIEIQAYDIENRLFDSLRIQKSD